MVWDRRAQGDAFGNRREAKEINAGLADAQFKGRLIDLGGEPMPLSIADFSKFIESETEKWAKVVKFSGAKAE